VKDILFWSNASQLPPTALMVALICALLGTAILSRFTHRAGLVSLLINMGTLFLGAYFANLLTAALELPLERHYVRPILMSVLGMSASSVLVLMLFSRTHNTD
jgi:hypothetical protein